DDRWPKRQIEIYASGDVLTYDGDHIKDDYGGLSEAALDGDEWERFEISADEFKQVWESVNPRNRSLDCPSQPLVDDERVLCRRTPGHCDAGQLGHALDGLSEVERSSVLDEEVEDRDRGPADERVELSLLCFAAAIGDARRRILIAARRSG